MNLVTLTVFLQYNVSCFHLHGLNAGIKNSTEKGIQPQTVTQKSTDTNPQKKKMFQMHRFFH